MEVSICPMGFLSSPVAYRLSRIARRAIISDTRYAIGYLPSAICYPLPTVHDPRQLFDHVQPRHIALHLRDVRPHLVAEIGLDLAQVLVLHLDPVAEVR